MQKTIKVTRTEIIKQGNTNGKDWVIYKVFCENDPEMKEFTTFNGDFANAQGQQMQVNVAYNDQYKNYQEISAQKEAENVKHDELMNGIRENWKKMETIENLLNAINTKMTEYPDQEPNAPIKEDIGSIPDTVPVGSVPKDD